MVLLTGRHLHLLVVLGGHHVLRDIVGCCTSAQINRVVGLLVLRIGRTISSILLAFHHLLIRGLKRGVQTWIASLLGFIEVHGGVMEFQVRKLLRVLLILRRGRPNII